MNFFLFFSPLPPPPPPITFLMVRPLDIDITLKNKAGQSYDPVTTIHVVVYGVIGNQNDVDSRVWERVYLIENNAVKFEANIDMNKKNILNVDNLLMNNFINMNKKQIKGFGDDNENDDAVNVKQLNDMEKTIENYVRGEISKVKVILQKMIINSKDRINNAIAEYAHYLICVFYLDNELNNGAKISTLSVICSFTFL